MAALQFVKEKSVLVHRKEIERGIRETPSSSQNVTRSFHHLTLSISIPSRPRFLVTSISCGALGTVQ